MNLQQAKALFFAQYLTQPVLRCISRPKETFKVLPYDCTESETTNFLLLRTVNQLTDEEYIEVSKLLGYKGVYYEPNLLQTGKVTVGLFRSIINEFETKVNVHNIARIQDYLRSIGILLPLTYIDETGKPVTKSVEEIIALNWAKIKENVV